MDSLAQKTIDYIPKLDTLNDLINITSKLDYKLIKTNAL